MNLNLKFYLLVLKLVQEDHLFLLLQLSIIVFKQDQVMKEHKTSYPITVEVFEGEILFGVNGQTNTLTRGDIVSLEANVPHNLKANKNSIVRLSLSKKDSINRVKGVLKL